jgi:hypothetical protein
VCWPNTFEWRLSRPGVTASWSARSGLWQRGQRLDPATHHRHQQVRVREERFLNWLVDPATVLAMPQPEGVLPCRRHEEAIDVEAETIEHGANVKMLDLRECDGHTISNGAFNGSHDVIVQPWTRQDPLGLPHSFRLRLLRRFMTTGNPWPCGDLVGTREMARTLPEGNRDGCDPCVCSVACSATSRLTHMFAVNERRGTA